MLTLDAWLSFLVKYKFIHERYLFSDSKCHIDCRDHKFDILQRLLNAYITQTILNWMCSQRYHRHLVGTYYDMSSKSTL